MSELDVLSAPHLLALHADLSEELRNRGVVRSANNPTGDLAEHLFCRAFDWSQSPNSEKGMDAANQDGVRFQIKGRRIHRRNKSRQLSSIRDLHLRQFDFLAGVLFHDDYTIMRAAIIPFGIIEAVSTFVPYTNSHRVILADELWSNDGVRDVTAQLRSVRL